jgi:hypothetical protein
MRSGPLVPDASSSGYRRLVKLVMSLENVDDDKDLEKR